MRELPGSRLFQEVVTNECKDPEVGECLKELVKKANKVSWARGKMAGKENKMISRAK